MRFLKIAYLVLICYAGDTATFADSIPDEGLTARMSCLEAETETLRAEVQRLREHPTRLPAVEARPVSAEMFDMAQVDPAAPPYMTAPQVQAEIKKAAWSKGDFTIVPYGILWSNMVYATQRTSPGSFTLFVQSPSIQDDHEFVVDARNTRLGMDISGPKIPCFNCAASGGKIEIDFQQNIVSTENRPTPQLRHAYWEVKNEEFRLLVGETWDVISPLMPGTVLYSVGWDGGDIGFRRTQFRYERYHACSDVSLVTMQASLNQTVFEEASVRFPSELPNWPIAEMRAAVTLGDRSANGLPVTFGVSGHIGEEENDVVTGTPAVVVLRDVHRRTWSFNADFRWPITHRLGVQAEVFTGENLGAFLGGIGQGIDLTTLNPIRSNGGWIDVWYDWTPRLHSHAGYSIDDPNDHDVVTVGERKYNSFYFGNIVYDITKNFTTGLEVSSWRTLYVGLAAGDSVRCEYMMKYAF
jgi:hypothetical protein